MMTQEGAQRVLDYRVFGHNFRKFPEHITKIKKKYGEYRILLTKLPDGRLMAGHGMYFKHEFKKLDKWYGNYQQLWDQYFTIL